MLQWYVASFLSAEFGAHCACIQITANFRKTTATRRAQLSWSPSDYVSHSQETGRPKIPQGHSRSVKCGLDWPIYSKHLHRRCLDGCECPDEAFHDSKTLLDPTPLLWWHLKKLTIRAPHKPSCRISLIHTHQFGPTGVYWNSILRASFEWYY